MPAAFWRCSPRRARRAAAMRKPKSAASALNSLAELVDPPGNAEIGGVRDKLFSVGDGAIVLRIYSPLGKPERVLPGIGVLSRRRLGGRQPGNP